jgi:hypothetical protein
MHTVTTAVNDAMPEAQSMPIKKNCLIGRVRGEKHRSK